MSQSSDKFELQDLFNTRFTTCHHWGDKIALEVECLFTDILSNPSNIKKLMQILAPALPSFIPYPIVQFYLLRTFRMKDGKDYGLASFKNPTLLNDGFEIKCGDEIKLPILNGGSEANIRYNVVILLYNECFVFLNDDNIMPNPTNYLGSVSHYQLFELLCSERDMKKLLKILKSAFR